MAKYKYFVRLLYTQVLCYKVTRRLDPNSRNLADHRLVEGLSKTVKRLMPRQSTLSNDAVQYLRSQYARKVCDALRSIGYKRYEELVSPTYKYDKAFLDSMLPIARAAIGNKKVLRLVSSSLKDATSCRKTVLPNILEAAVAAGQKDLVVEMLETYTATGGLDKSKINTRAERRTVADAMGAALRVAARLSRNSIGFQIIDFFRHNWDSLGSLVSLSTIRGIYDDCVEYGNTGLYSTVLYWKRKMKLPESSTDLELQLTEFDFSYVYRRALPVLVHHLVKTGILNPNYINGKSPLWLALEARKYKAAKLLIDCGADINRVLPDQQQTAYWKAYDDGDGDAQWYLIKWGADTRPMSEHGTPGTPGTSLSIPRIRLKNEFTKRWENWKPERPPHF